MESTQDREPETSSSQLRLISLSICRASKSSDCCRSALAFAASASLSAVAFSASALSASIAPALA
jgi:hypothetical protein